MAIVISSSSAAPPTLEPLVSQPGAAGVQVDGTAPTPLTAPASLVNDLASATDTFSLSGGAAAALLGGLSSGLANAASAADAAVSAGGVVLGLLGKLQSDAKSAADPSLSTDQRDALNADFQSNLAQINETLGGAGAGGLNLLDGSASGPQSLDGGATLTGTDLSVGGPIVGLSPDANLSDAGSAASIADQIGQAIDQAGQALAQISSQGQTIESHLALVSQAASSLSPMLAGAINVGLNDDGARLQALQVQQQLAGVGSGLANQAPQAILALFQ